MFSGRDIQRVGGRKALSPTGVTPGLRDGKEASVRGAESGRRGAGVEHFFKVGGGLVVGCFMGKEEDFELDAVRQV